MVSITKIYMKKFWNYLTKKGIIYKKDASILQKIFKIIVPWWTCGTWPLDKTGTAPVWDTVIQDNHSPELW